MATARTAANEHETALTIRMTERETCPEGSVPLHRLCDNCQKFFDSWDVLDLLGPGRVAKDVPAYPEEEYHFCTITQLLSSQGRCHCCMLLLASMIDSLGSDFVQYQETVCLSMSPYDRFLSVSLL
jgi:hypothetical protein